MALGANGLRDYWPGGLMAMEANGHRGLMATNQACTTGLDFFNVAKGSLSRIKSNFGK